MAVTTGLLFLSAVLSWWLTFGQVDLGRLAALHRRARAVHPRRRLPLDWSVRIDALSAVMLVVVTTVSALVHLYSWGYMAEDDCKPRFFAYLSLFTFAMLALVTAADFMQLFFGWEGVGLASYLLIGFWYQEAHRQRRGDQGLRGQPGRRLRLRARHHDRLLDVRHRSGSPRSSRRSPPTPMTPGPSPARPGA